MSRLAKNSNFIQSVQFYVPFRGFHRSRLSWEVGAGDQYTVDISDIKNPNWAAARALVADYYVAGLNELFDITIDDNNAVATTAKPAVDMPRSPLKFIEVISPEAYNYTADKIFVAVPRGFWRAFFTLIYQDADFIAAELSKALVAREGFAPLVSGNLNSTEWMTAIVGGTLSSAQVSILFDIWAKANMGKDDIINVEDRAFEDAINNGAMYNVMMRS